MADVSARISALSPSKRALLLERLGAGGGARAPSGEPVAVLGMGCRFPGGGRDPEAFYRLLQGGVDAIREVPPERWDAAALFDPDPAAPGKTAARWGGFLDDIDRFDAAFFGISPREALRMDPKQRLLLEVVWEALDDAGSTPSQLAGSRTGVFVAVYQSDWSRLVTSDPAAIDAWAGTGAQQCLAANRISYLLDLRGPSLVVDTACSSSLTAIHLAVQALRSGECDRAIVGAVSLVLLPEECIAMSKLGMMAADGRCKTFDARADGFVRGEGAGALVLERLEGAIADGAEPLAVILGTAMNQDGRTNGLTAPSGRAQEEVIRSALADAGAAPDRVGYVEAHGTGTPLGDPIEVEALAAVMGSRADGQRCVLGAVKTNVGHLEAAAGMAGFIKVVLALRHGSIPPNLHLASRNPRIPIEGSPFVLPSAPIAWPRGEAPRLAGVSSFGMGGTNAHVIVGEPPAVARPARQGDARPHLVVISAHTEEALRELARAHRDRAAGGPAIQDLAAALALRRHAHDHRLAVVARDRAELEDRLDAFLRDEARPGTTWGRRAGAPRRVALVFPGQGSQRPGMGLGLLGEPAFRDAMDRCERAIAASEGWSLMDALAAPEDRSPLDRIEVLQPALFAVQVALAALFRAWGIEPDAVIGHSLGEVAAAHVAGALPLDAAVRVIATRSRLLARLRGTGAMASVVLSAEDAARAAAGAPGVVVAACNGPAATVLAGDAAAIDELLAALGQRGVSCRRINVDVASHTPAMDAITGPLIEALGDLRPTAAALPIYSTVTAAPARGDDLDAGYWARNLRQPVLFWQAAERLVADGNDVLLELSAHATIAGVVGAALRAGGRPPSAIGSLRRGEDDRAAALGALGALWAMGAPVRWEALHPEGARRVDLPAYPWQRERFPIPTLATPRAAPSAGAHPLLGARVDVAGPDGARVWHAALDAAALRFLRDHRVEDAAVLPGTASVEIAIAAAREVFGRDPAAIERLRFDEHVLVAEGGSSSIQVSITLDSPGGAEIRVHGRSSEDAPWTLHASAAVLLGPPASKASIDLTALIDRCPDEIAGPDLYARLAARGNRWGPAFQGIARLLRGRGEALVEVAAPPSIAAEIDRYRLHPALLDAFGQALGALVEGDGDAGPAVLSAIDRVTVRGPLGPRMWGHIALTSSRPDEVAADLRIADPEGRVAVEILGLRVRRLDPGASARPRIEDALHEVRWRESPQPARAASKRGGLIVVPDRSDLGERLLACARAAGEQAVLAPRGAEQVAALLRDTIGAAPSAPWDLVVLSTDSMDALPTTTDPSALEASALDAAERVLRSLHAITAAPRGHRLAIVTRGATLAPTVASAASATLWGLARVIAAEHPGCLAGIVDLPASGAIDVSSLLDALSSRGEPEIALRDGRHWVPRLARRVLDPARRMPLRIAPDRTTLITGGLGDLGLLVARRLVERGARHLVLLGRTGLPPRARWRDAPPGSPLAARIHAVRGLEAMGAGVHVAAVDVGDEAALDGFLAAFTAEMRPPIRGVIHAAGIHVATPLASLDRAGLAADFRAKVRGAAALHRAFSGPDLDFFVLFSSAAALLGSPFLGAYAAASAFLDALARARRSEGLPAISVDWGFWAEAGMAARGERERGRSFTPRGARAFSPEEGLDALERILAEDPCEIAVTPVDWAAYRRFHPAAASAELLADLVAGTGEGDRDRGAPPLTRDALLGVDPGARAALLEGYLRGRVASVLRLPVARVEIDQPLTRMGLDSLMAVELKHRIEDDLGLTLPIVDVLGSAGVARLAARLHDLASRLDPEGWEEISL